MSEIDLRPSYDPDHERRLVERHAAADAAADWSGVAPQDCPPHGADRAIDQWTQRQVAQAGHTHAAAVSASRDRIAALAAEGQRREREAEEARSTESRTVRGRDQLTAVLSGDRRGRDDGDWEDPGRMSEKPWLAAAVGALIYAAAAVADAGLNYLAFRVMGVSPVETVILAAGVVMVTVLLPKQIGEMLEAHRRGARGTTRRNVLMLVAGTLWLGVSLFTAVIRTNYLMLPAGLGTGAERPSLPELAGVAPAILVAGWLVVALAIGLVVLVHAKRRYNPVVRPWRDAVRSARTAHTETVRLRWESDRASHDLGVARDELTALDSARDRDVEICRAFGDELKQVYRSAYLRALGAPERRRPNDPPAIAPLRDAS